MKNTKEAFHIINKTVNEKAYANLLMQHLDEDYNAAFITELVYGTLRNYRLVREGWRHFVKDELDKEISVLLDLGIYMLLYIDNTPNYAIVNNLVEISKELEYGKYTRLTNAILKRFIKEGMRTFDESIEDLSIKYSNPLWLTKMWEAHYGTEKTILLLKDNLKEDRVTLRINTHKISKIDLLNDSDFIEGTLSSEEVYYSKNIFETKYFKEGYVSVQDAASQQVAHVVNAHPSDKVLDACSAPGSKAFHIASLRNDEGMLDAVELHETRANLIKEGARKLQLKSIKVYTQDARHLEDIFEENSYDKVLLDVPCTGFGVMKNKPEIKINTTPEDVDAIVLVQEEIIDSAVKMVKVNGDLIYSTCTLNRKENEGQIKNLLKKYPNFELIDEKTIFGFENDSDSFYIAHLKKLN